MKFVDDDVIVRINCYCHLLHNVVVSMCAVEPVKKIVDDTSSLVSLIRCSGLGSTCEPKLKKYVSTRWNTVYEMFNSVSTNYVRISEIILEKVIADGISNNMDRLTVIPQNALKDIIVCLEKFRTWTNYLQADTKPTLWMAWPIFIKLKAHLEASENDTEIIGMMKNAGRWYVRNNLHDFEPTIHHKIATVCHPLLKKIGISTPEERNAIYKHIDEMIAQNGSPNPPGTPTLVPNQDILAEFMGCAVLTQSTSGNGISDELERYTNCVDKFHISLIC